MIKVRFCLLVLVTILLFSLAACTEGVDDAGQPAATAALTRPPAAPSASPSPTAFQQFSYDKFIDALGQLDRRLRVEQEATYAGYCLPQPGRREAILAFTAEAEDMAQTYLAGQPLAVYVSVSDRPADYPVALLNAAVPVETERVYKMGFDVMGWTDDCLNRVVLTVISPAEVEAALVAAGESLPPYVELVAGSMVTPES